MKMEATTQNHKSLFVKKLVFFCFCIIQSSLSLSDTSPSVSKSTYVFPKEALPSKSGYLPVSPTSSSSIFYTFYEAQNSTSPLSQTPLLIWLQGGPGCSSMIGNFYELGPWRVTNSLTLQPNPGAWNRIFGLLFLDSPIGTGFSIASTPEEIPTDQNTVAKHLFAAITRFVQLDPVFKYRPIYITGESYAGKYVPAIGYYILEKNAQLKVSERVNLAGVAIGDGLTDPVTQVVTHASNAYYVGLINERQKNELEKAQLEAVRLTQIGNWSEATDARNKVLRMLQNMTGLATLYDYTRKIPYEDDLVAQFLNLPEVRKALGVTVNESFVYEVCSDTVGSILHADVMKSVKYMVEHLVRRSRVLLYQGQYDLRDGVVQVEAWVKTMKWEGIVEFLNAERKIWKVNGEHAGYVQNWKSLTNVVVLGAGHLLPTDQAVNSQAMIEDWVLEKGFFKSEQQKKNASRNSAFAVELFEINLKF
ncbi:Serine carboxypeptidase, serine active site [Sesbania bispinosa]|nr:Serine carboxypeptidase, serine active site [Sesbania bispinosa]